MRLFFYGVLLEGLGAWPFLDGLGPARPARAKGQLFALRGKTGWYPALLAGEGRITGAVHDAGGADIAAMDAFEGPDYARTPIAVDAGGELLQAQAYVWAADLPIDAQRIPHGDFARWLKETGRSPITD